MKAQNAVSTMTVLLRTSAVAGLGVLLVGCASTKDWAMQDYAATPLSEAAKSGPTALTSIKASLISNSAVPQACFENGDESTCRGPRNAATAGLMAASDEICVTHVRTIYGNEAAYNLTLGTMTNLFAGAAAIAEQASKKSLFSGLALFSSAERSLINETVYKTMLVTAVSRKIREGRLEHRNAILTKLRNETVASYSLTEGVLDVLAYHHTCSFMYGLEKALEEGNQNGTERRKLMLEAELRRLLAESRLVQAQPNSVEQAYVDGLKSRITAISKEVQEMSTPVSTPPKQPNGSGNASAPPPPVPRGAAGGNQ